MKKIILILSTVLLLASCSASLTEKVEASYPNGNPQTVRFFDKNGNCVKEAGYYESGQVRIEGPMKDGKMEGVWRSYYPNGRPWSIGEYKDGKAEGATTVYWENGNLRWEGFYKEGIHCGKWKYYEEQGDLLKEVDYGE